MKISCFSADCKHINLEKPAFARVTIGSNNPPDASAVLDCNLLKGLAAAAAYHCSAQRHSAAFACPGDLQYRQWVHWGYFPGGWKALQCDCNNAPQVLP